MNVLLVVEDDYLIRTSLQMLLEMEGYQTHAVENGEEALRYLKTSATLPCLIVLDLMMPVMDGVEFRLHQLADPEIATVPILVVTGKSDIRDVEALAPLDVLRKPFQPSQVLGIINRVCPSAGPGQRSR